MSPRRHNMAHRVSSTALCCVLQACLVLGAVYTPSGGPVYVNPAAPVAAAPAVNAEQLVTQTVYGFLDFTTTIGNTVMVFSPQSAPAAEAPKPSAPPAPVIETKPPPSATAAAPDIKPSKTTATANKSSDKKAAAAPAPPPSAPAPAPAAPVAVVSSVVEVVGGPAPPPPPPSAPGPKANAAPSSVVEVRGPASKVEVREGTTKVEVHAATASAAASAATPVLSSIVEVRASGGDENNVDDPEYDFLSRQPAQIVDETYKVINLKPSAKARRYKSRPSQPSPAADASTSLYKFKLSRPAGRWSYKTTPKPRVAIRRQDGDEAPAPALNPAPVAQSPAPAAPAPQLPDDAENEPAARLEPEQASPDSAAEPSDPEERPAPAAETIKVQISTPADFSDVYYELATIKSPYTFQAGTVKNTRYITVTSTLAKTLSSSVEATSAASGVAPSASAAASLAPGEEPLTENLLASTLTPHYERREPLDADGIATLPPIALAGDASTPPLQTLTEAFSTTQLLLKTHVLPVIRDGTNTTRYTLVQSYHVTRLVTALKTLPPMEVYHFVPSKTLTDLNTRLEEAGSELHLELDFGEEDGKENDEDRPAAALRALAPDLDLANVGSDFDLADVDRSRLPELQQHLRLKKAQSEQQAHNQLTTPPPPPPQPQLSPEQLQQLALLRLFNPAAAAALPQVITTSRPIVKVETVFESHVIPVLNGQTTSYSTISRPIATVSKTEYELATSTVPLPLPLPPVNPLFPNQQQPQFAVTSSPLVTQTVVTATESKVLKLTFGAKTAYTTLYSTRVVPTVLTTYLTASVPVQPTAAFPGYFPPAYPQFPFVG